MQPIGAILLSFAALAAAAPLEARATDSAATDNSGPFQVYGYGEGIGGLFMFSTGGSKAGLGTFCLKGNHQCSLGDFAIIPFLLILQTYLGDVYFGDYTKLNDSNAAPVLFTLTDTDTWIGAPNTTATATDPNWSNLTFSIPAQGSSDHDVGFLNSNTTSSGRQTSGFLFYGSFIFVKGATGSLQSLWYAAPSSIDGIFSLKWNVTDNAAGRKNDDTVVLTLKKTAPSNAADVDPASA
ncbi:hypothetical protein CORC01_05369 [Colletotrichum orchidophilum]|uniref:Uncharacterized protein n=1 Tax=Colletotrichum orchidophilum TaxID=1209926 RepID=A0A1G4BD41_9PEZI|nr:uncharacterized protein CORC01_05369 [Colletotrichum orchidophilum]OHE99328.1 hypothetical protein CORC01_05369 [Colletotrichum orchidophilum]